MVIPHRTSRAFDLEALTSVNHIPNSSRCRHVTRSLFSTSNDHPTSHPNFLPINSFVFIPFLPPLSFQIISPLWFSDMKPASVLITRPILADASLASPVRAVRLFFSDTVDAFRRNHYSFRAPTATRLLSLLLLHPIDSAKARIQVSVATSPAAVSTAAQRGAWMRGLFPSLLARLPHAALTFALFSVINSRFSRNLDAFRPSTRTVLAACGADALSAMWLTPFELAKIRLQTNVAPSFQSAFTFGKLYTGVCAQVLRDVPFRALFILAYNVVSSEIDKRIDRPLRKVESVAIATVTAAATAAFTTPLDVVRTRVMAQFPGAVPLYSNALHCASKTIRGEGIKSMYRGMLPRTVYMSASVVLFSLALGKITEAVDKIKRKSEVASKLPSSVQNVLFVPPS